MLIGNNVFVVTGAASGLGRATATMLTKQGGQVVLVDLDEERGRVVGAELTAQFIERMYLWSPMLSPFFMRR